MICDCSYGRKLLLKSIYKFFSSLFNKIFSSFISDRHLTVITKNNSVKSSN